MNAVAARTLFMAVAASPVTAGSGRASTGTTRGQARAMDDGTDDGRGNNADAVRWMTCAELAKLRGISAASATQLAVRRNWRRQGGNDKTARMAVPIGEIMPKTDTPRMLGVMSGGDIARAIATLESALAELHDRAESTEKRMDRAEARAAVAERRADRAEARALAAEAEATASRERADREASILRAQIEAERGRADQAEAEVAVSRGQITAERDLAVATHNRIALEIETLRQRDRERRELGTLKRLWAAWRRE
jgi:hypothetical protein